MRKRARPAEDGAEDVAAAATRQKPGFEWSFDALSLRYRSRGDIAVGATVDIPVTDDDAASDSAAVLAALEAVDWPMEGLDDRELDVLGGDEFGGDVAQSFCLGPVLAWRRSSNPTAVPGPGRGGAGVCGGSGIVASAAAQGRPHLCRLLNRFGRAVLPADAAWTSISVNRNYRTALHIDRASLGPSWIIGFGAYTGGELWTEKTGPVDVKEKVVAFDGNLPHVRGPSCMLWPPACNTIYTLRLLVWH